MFKSLIKLASAAALASCFVLPAQADADDQAELLRDASRVVSHLRSDPAFATARTMLQGAEAVAQIGLVEQLFGVCCRSHCFTTDLRDDVARCDFTRSQ